MSRITWNQIKPVMEAVSGADHVGAPYGVQQEMEALINHFYELGRQEGESEFVAAKARADDRERRELAKAMLVAHFGSEAVGRTPGIVKGIVNTADALLSELRG